MVRTHHARLSCYPYWLMDFVTDPRVLHNTLPTSAIGWMRARRGATQPLEAVQRREPLLALSFDVERDTDAPFESSRSITACPFLWEFARCTAGTPIRGTFFIQGEMVRNLAEPLGMLSSSGHLIGLHGYRHELWGRRNWKIHRPPITSRERDRRLIVSLENFARAGLPHPVAFRAPNLTVDGDTYRLLERYGFSVDSSPPTQRGNSFRPVRRGALRIVPVSCGPLPSLHVNHRIRIPTAVRFHQFNYDLYVRESPGRVSNLVEETLRFQLAEGIPPHLVMYAHNWEFARDGLGRSVDTLIERTCNLMYRYGMRSVTIGQLADRLFPEEEAG